MPARRRAERQNGVLIKSDSSPPAHSPHTSRFAKSEQPQQAVAQLLFKGFSRHVGRTLRSVRGEF